MLRKIIPTLICIAGFSLLTKKVSHAAQGDTTIVITHNQQVVVTNPSTGNNPYLAWGVFPSASTQYRKVIITLKYKCPPGMACGEWDYIDWVWVRRMGGITAPSKDMEICRYITPYGNGNGPTWHAEWHLDITDYAMLLHDSVEIEYNHTGYETNVGKGWLLDVVFTLIEGTPVCEPINIHQLWNGSFTYGNASDPIDNHLEADTLVSDSTASVWRMKVLQSGHGSDASNCAEFCSKLRYVLFDNTLVDTRSIWKLCGYNPIYPQGGTWVYNRANWCPGMIVYPDDYDFNVTGNSQHIVDINMQAYTAANPSANYAIDAHLIEYKAPLNQNDASIEEIYQPNDLFEYSRINPVCANPKIQLRNNGTNVLTSATIKYGLGGQVLYTYSWTGNLDPLKKTDVQLGNIIPADTGLQTFVAYLENVNGVTDQYTYDDTVYTQALIPPVLDSNFIFHYKTNNIPGQNSFVFNDAAGNIILQKGVGSMTANTIYRDTLRLQPGCYRLKFYDTGGDGLSFWANSAQGSGYARLLKMNGLTQIKSFNADFGKEFEYSFTIDSLGSVSTSEIESIPSWYITPNPNNGIFHVILSLPDLQDITIEILNVTGQVMQAEHRNNLSSEAAELNLKEIAAGIYFVKVTGRDFTETKRIVVYK